MQRCDFKSERSCSCGPNECRVQIVYRTNDMTGVFTVPARVQIAFLAFVAVMLLIGCTTYQLNQAEKQEIARAV